MATQSIPRVSEEEYLRLDRAAEYKSEFLDGEIFAMSGGSLRHSRLAVSWARELDLKLRTKNCHVFSSDARLRTPVSGSYLYPDVSVVCGTPQTHRESNDILTNPSLVIEVLSPSTTGYDRGKKFERYREIPSLRDYILVHADAPHAEHFARQPDTSWVFRDYSGLDSVVPFDSIGCAISLKEVYAGVLEIPG